MTPNPASPTDKIRTTQICATEGVGDRCLRQWIAKGRFPAPDGNLNGRNFWLRSTYERWKAEVLDGKFCQRRRPGVSAQAA